MNGHPTVTNCEKDILKILWAQRISCFFRAMPRIISLALGSSVHESVRCGSNVGNVFSQRGTKSLFVSSNLKTRNGVKIRLGPIEAVSDPLVAGANLASELGIQVTETGTCGCKCL